MNPDTKNFRQLLNFYEVYKPLFHFDKAVYRFVKGKTVGNPDYDWYEFCIPIKRNQSISYKVFDELKIIIDKVWPIKSSYLSYINGQLNLILIH